MAPRSTQARPRVDQTQRAARARPASSDSSPRGLERHCSRRGSEPLRSPSRDPHYPWARCTTRSGWARAHRPPSQTRHATPSAVQSTTSLLPRASAPKPAEGSPARASGSDSGSGRPSPLGCLAPERARARAPPGARLEWSAIGRRALRLAGPAHHGQWRCPGRVARIAG